MLNEYGGESTPWGLPKATSPTPVDPPLTEYDGVVNTLTEGPMRLSVKDVVKGALDHLNKHPDAALLAYRLLSQRFAISG